MSVSVTQEVVKDSDFDFSHLDEELSVGERASERGLVDSQTIWGVHLSVLVGVRPKVEHKTVFLTSPDEHRNVDSVPGRINATTVNCRLWNMKLSFNNMGTLMRYLYG